jgi:hypothetical protein
LRNSLSGLQKLPPKSKISERIDLSLRRKKPLNLFPHKPLKTKRKGLPKLKYWKLTRPKKLPKPINPFNINLTLNVTSQPLQICLFKTLKLWSGACSIGLTRIRVDS